MPAAMRKPKLQIDDPAQIEEILRRGQVLRLAMCRDGQPYLVPLHYAYGDGRIYLHTGHEGLKMEFLAANPRVCFEVSVDVELVPGPAACKWNCRYRSVLGFGRAFRVEDQAERMRGLLAISRRYAGPGPQELPAEACARACVLRIDIDELTGKRNPVED